MGIDALDDKSCLVSLADHIATCPLADAPKDSEHSDLLNQHLAATEANDSAARRRRNLRAVVPVQEGLFADHRCTEVNS
eukprot:jgi/Chrzof1/8037/UNPLg00082.t1